MNITLTPEQNNIITIALVALLVLVVVIAVIRKAISNKKASTLTVQESPAPAPTAPSTEAPGSAGQIKLHNVEPQTAALLMAIVADKLDKPLNELRFISIKEVQ